MPDNHVQHHSNSEDTIGFPVGTINKVEVLRLKYSVLSIFREVGSTF